MTTVSVTTQDRASPPPRKVQPLPDVRAQHRRHVVEIRSVTKTFGEHRAVDDLSLSVSEGTICGFIGPNGSGKTTTLRMMMRIFRPDEGAGLIRILGVDDGHAPSDQVGYLPEERGLYKRMKVIDVLRFYAELKGCTEFHSVARTWLERMELAHTAQQRVETLSKGMAQKVQFISAVINNPQLLILDEPFSGLDPVNADVVRTAILDLKRRGTSIIYSTHDMNMAEQLCDEIVMLHQGRKVLDGSLDAIQDQYGTDTIRVQLDDADVPLADIPSIAQVTEFGHLRELRMEAGYDAKRVLQNLIRLANVRHFEIRTPSLHDIFVRIAKIEPAETIDA